MGDHMTRNLLVEILVEELPPKALKKLGDAFAKEVAGNLTAQGLATADAPVTAYASPRRLAVHVGGVAAAAPDRPVSHKLMPVAVGLSRAGYAGALAAWTGFTVPSALALVLFAYGVAALGDAAGSAWLHGLKVAA